MKIEVSGISDIGGKRSQNQDAILVYEDKAKEFGLFIVADGMGGYAHGERASAEIASGMREWAVRAPEEILSGPALGALEAARDRLAEINRFIWEAWNQGSTCGSTCVLLLTLRDTYGALSVGDSRIYRSRGFQCGPITRDDVWENQEKVRAAYTPEEIRRNPNYGKLLSAVGGGKTLSCALQTEELRKGDVFALCSDGVYKMCEEKFLLKKIRAARRRDMDEVRDEILGEVYRSGAKDNASLILVRCV